MKNEENSERRHVQVVMIPPAIFMDYAKCSGFHRSQFDSLS
jgi:hypothetical protein